MTDPTDIREFLHRMADEAGVVPVDPVPVVRNARRRLVFTVAGTLLTVGVLVAGGVLGVNRLTSIPPAVPASPGPTTEPSVPFAQVHGWITYRSGSDIMAVDPTHPENGISLGPSHGLDPIAWSRNGSRLLGRAKKNLYVLNADGSRRQLTRGGITAWGSFSPDGEMVAYDWASGDLHRLYVIDSAGGTPKLLLASGDRMAFLTFPAWSPDGSQIAFIESTVVGETSWGERIYRLTLSVVNADGTGERVLRDLGREDRSPTGWAKGLVWSPDGSRFAFSSQSIVGPASQLYVVNADGSELRRLTKRMNYASNASWSPDGSRIAFVRGSTLFTMAADGSDVRPMLRPVKKAIAWNPVSEEGNQEEQP